MTMIILSRMNFSRYIDVFFSYSLNVLRIKAGFNSTFFRRKNRFVIVRHTVFDTFCLAYVAV